MAAGSPPEVAVGLGPTGPSVPDAPPPLFRQRHPRLMAGRDALAGYGFVAPFLLLLAVFVLIPLVGSVLTSFKQTNGFGAGHYVGLANYEQLLRDGLFWRSAANTVLFTLIVTPTSMALGLAMAVLLNSVLPARGLFRSIVIIPMAVSGVATALIGVLIFDQNTGILNKLLAALDLPTVSWQSGSAAAFGSVVLITLWWRVGFNMLIYLAGLQGISPELYEAGTLDGAGSWARLRHLTVPLLGPSTFFLLIINVIYSFQVFDIVFVLTGGGPRNATSVLVTYAYDTGFTTRDQGYAAAIGMILLVVMVSFAVIQWRSSASRDITE